MKRADYTEALSTAKENAFLSSTAGTFTENELSSTVTGEHKNMSDLVMQINSKEKLTIINHI